MATAVLERPTSFIPAHENHIPSLGYAIIDQIIAYQCHGPGDLQGKHVTYDQEIRDFIIEAYRIDPETGARFYTQEIFSRQKGRAKSEVAGHLAVEEAVGFCRFDHWADGTEDYPVPHMRPDGKYLRGEPVLREVTGPLIKCLASEESQAGNTFQVVSYIMSDWAQEEGEDRHPRYAGITGARTYQSATALYLPKGGEIRACSSGAASKDGGKETFVVADETHLYTTRELKDMFATIAKNLGSKRKLSEPHLLQTSTAPRQGEQSVYESTLAMWRKGELPARTLFDHKEAKGPIRIRDREHTMKQLYDLWGEAASWQDMDRKYEDMLDPLICRDDAEAARYYLNRMIASKDAWIAKEVHEQQTRPRKVGETEPERWVVQLGEPISLGFDGSINDDTTVLRGCRMSDGFLFKLGVWAKPEGAAGIGWQVPRTEVLQVIRDVHERYTVVRGYYDPHEWRSDIDALAEELDPKDPRGVKLKGKERVIPWETNRDTSMGRALDRLHADLTNGVATHDNDPIAAEHYGNAYTRHRGVLRLVRKEYPNSPRKIDSVVGDALAYEARADAIADGWDQKPTGPKRARGRTRAY